MNTQDIETVRVEAEVPGTDADLSSPVGDDLVSAIGAAAASRPPRRVVGRRSVCFSPVRYYALTQVHREDVDAFDIDLFLKQEPLRTVDARGIMLGGEWYLAPELQMLTTGDKDAPERNLAIRYDRSRFARGTLDRVHVGEIGEDGCYTYLFTCIPRDEALATLDADRVLRERERYLRQLVFERDDLQAEYVALTAGRKAEEDLLRGRAEQRRNQMRIKQPARFVEPIRSDQGSAGDGEGKLGVALREDGQGAGSDESPNQSDLDGSEPAAGSAAPSARKDTAGLGAALRGQSGVKKK